MIEPITVIFFSCRRLNLLQRTVNAFITHNTYPIYEFIIVNDSTDSFIHERLRQLYPDFTLVLNKENVGLFKSIDLGYAHVKTEYLFHCEDDWMVTKDGFLPKSLWIMQNNPMVEEVWLKDYNNHPMDDCIYDVYGLKYKLASQNVNKGFEGYDEGWHGFATACSLKRLSDYRKVAPYSDIEYRGSWKKPTIWHREYAIGLEYYKLGYRTAVLIDDEYATNIGIGQSEYKTGNEK